MQIRRPLKTLSNTRVDAILSGWVLDVYPDEDGGLAVWFVTVNDERLRLKADFSARFYVSGPKDHLRALWNYLSDLPYPLKLQNKSVLVIGHGRQNVLEVSASYHLAYQAAVSTANKRLPTLTLLNHSIPFSTRFFCRHNVLPHSFVYAAVSQGKIVSFIPRHPDDVNPAEMPFRLLRIHPVRENGRLSVLEIISETGSSRIPLKPRHRMLINLAALIRRVDPDIVMIHPELRNFFPQLARYCRDHNLSHFNPNRDQLKTHWANRLYGRVLLDEGQVDGFSAYDLDGLIEQAQMTGMTLHDLAGLDERGRAFTQLESRLEAGGRLIQSIPVRRVSIPSPGIIKPAPGRYTFVGLLGFPAFHACLFLQINHPEAGIHQDVLRPLAARQVALEAIRNTLDERDFEVPKLKRQIEALNRLSQAHLKLAFTRRPDLLQVFGKLAARTRITVQDIAVQQGARVLFFNQGSLWLSSPRFFCRRDLHPILDLLAEATGQPVLARHVLPWLQLLPATGATPAGFGHQMNGQPFVTGMPPGKVSGAAGEMQVALARLIGQLPSPGLVSKQLPEILAALRTRFPQAGQLEIFEAARSILFPLGISPQEIEALPTSVSTMRRYKTSLGDNSI